MGVQSSTDAISLSPLGEACVRKDLTAIHEVLVKLGYKDDEGAATEVRFKVLIHLSICIFWISFALWFLQIVYMICFLVVPFNIHDYFIPLVFEENAKEFLVHKYNANDLVL